MLGAFIVLSGLVVRLGQTTFDEDLCDAVSKAQNATNALNELAGNITKDHDLGVLKNRTLTAVKDQLRTVGRPYAVVSKAIDDWSLLTNDSSPCFQRLTAPAFITVEQDIPVPNSVALETIRSQYAPEEFKLRIMDSDRDRFVGVRCRSRLRDLRIQCDDARPESVVRWLYDQIVVTSRISNLLLDAVRTDLKAYRSLSHIILKDFHRGTYLRQVCMAVATRRVSPSAVAEEVSQHLEKYEEVFEKFIEGEGKVKQKSG